MDTVEVLSEESEDEATEMQGEPAGDQENLVFEYERDETKKKWLKDMAAKVVRLVKADNESRQEWIDRREAQVKLFAGMIGPMGYPAQGMRAPHDPIVCRTVLQMWTRGCEQICPSKGNLIQIQAIGPEDEEIAQRREQYMNWQLRNEVPNWVRGHREAYLQFLMSGSVFREHSLDPVTKATRFDTLTADDIIVCHTLKDLSPLMTRVPRVTRVLRYFRWELEEIRDSGTFANVDKVLAAKNTGDQEPSQLQEQADEIDGVTKQITVGASDDSDSQARILYRTHMWMTLPGEKRMRAVTITVDVATMTAVSLRLREDDDPLDKARFDQEMREWQATTKSIGEQYQAALVEWQQLAMQAQMTGAPVPPEPPQPQMPPEPKPPRQIPVFRVIHYRLFPNPNGFYGLGVAYLLENANELVNELEKEYLLAAKFENISQGFLPKGALGPGKGEVRLQMGKFTETELEAEQMPGIREFKFSGPSEALRKFIAQVKDDSYSLVADVDTLTGEAGPTNETKAAAEQRMSNASALMTSVAALYTETMAEEPKMLARDNAMTMDEREYFWVTAPDKANPAAQGQSRVKKEALREDYVDEFDFTFTADQRFQTQPQRVQTAMNVIQTLMQSPYAQSPQGAPMFYLAFVKLFRALDMPEFEQAMGQPPQPPAPEPPPTPMSQEDENAMFMQDRYHPALEADDHEGHLVVIDDLKLSPYYEQMSSTGKQMLDQHQREHVAMLYQLEMKLSQGDQNADGQGTPGGAPGMGGGPGYDQPPGIAPGAVGPGDGPPAFPI